jgi:hypothetical protein
VGRQHRTCKPCKPNMVRALNALRNESGCCVRVYGVAAVGGSSGMW